MELLEGDDYEINTICLATYCTDNKSALTQMAYRHRFGARTLAVTMLTRALDVIVTPGYNVFMAFVAGCSELGDL